MSLLLKIAICSGLSIIFKKLLFAYWTQEEGTSNEHNSDAWVFGIIAGITIGLLVAKGLGI